MNIRIVSTKSTVVGEIEISMNERKSFVTKVADDGGVLCPIQEKDQLFFDEHNIPVELADSFENLLMEILRYNGVLGRI